MGCLLWQKNGCGNEQQCSSPAAEPHTNRHSASVHSCYVCVGSGSSIGNLTFATFCNGTHSNTQWINDFPIFFFTARMWEMARVSDIVIFYFWKPYGKGIAKCSRHTYIYLYIQGVSLKAGQNNFAKSNQKNWPHITHCQGIHLMRLIAVSIILQLLRFAKLTF